MRVKTFFMYVVVKKCHLVRESAGFTHDMSHFELDVREKRFNAHASPGITFKRPGASAVTWFLTITKSNPHPSFP